MAHLGPLAISGGWVSFASIMLRFVLTVSAALILVAVTGPGCPACRVQRVVLDKFQKQHPEADLNILWVDYDHHKRVLRYVNATLAGTLVLYRGTERLGATVVEMQEDAIIAPILSAAAH
jgi:thiol-disulfide isomerase/thioredoxin